MGHYSVYCNFSRITITGGDEIVLIPIRKSSERYYPIMLPIFGKYSDYGEINDIEPNPKYEQIIKEVFKCDIQKLANKIIGLSDKKIKGIQYCFVKREVWDYLTGGLFLKKEHTYYYKNINTKDKKDKLDYLLNFFDLHLDLCFNYKLDYKNEYHNSLKSPYNNIIKSNFIKEEEKHKYDKQLIKYLERFRYTEKVKNVMENIIYNLCDYEDLILKLVRLKLNTWSISTGLQPYDNWINHCPQDGMFETHSMIMQKFLEINNKIISDYEN